MSANSRATDLSILKRTELQDVLKAIKYKGSIANKNKTQLIAIIMDEEDKGNMKQFEAHDAIMKMRQALGLSTHRNVKSRTQGLRKSKAEDAKSAKQQASEALALIKQAQNFKPKLKKQFLERMKKEVNEMEKDIDKITSKIPIGVERKIRRNRDIDSSGRFVSV